MDPVDIFKIRVASFQERLPTIVTKARAILEVAIRSQASLDDHTLKELRRLGHPYRQQRGETYYGVDKNGKWRAGIRRAARLVREGVLGHDIKLVHIQSHTLQDAIRSETYTTSEVIAGKVSVDESVAPYVKYVVLGTKKMIPRDFIGRGAVAAKSAMYALLRREMNEAFRAG